VDTVHLTKLLQRAPKDEVYRIKALFTASKPISGSDADIAITDAPSGPSRYILNWAFGRWTCTPVPEGVDEHESSDGVILRMTIILARYESTKWKKRIENDGFVCLEGQDKGSLKVEKIA
jgi:hypothetical protein